MGAGQGLAGGRRRRVSRIGARLPHMVRAPGGRRGEAVAPDGRTSPPREYRPVGRSLQGDPRCRPSRASPGIREAAVSPSAGSGGSDPARVPEWVLEEVGGDEEDEDEHDERDGEAEGEEERASDRHVDDRGDDGDRRGEDGE